MKQESKKFAIYKAERPKVLVLGNGVCRAFGGQSWEELLDTIKDSVAFPDEASHYVIPMPLKAAMLSNNQLAKKMRDLVEKKPSAASGKKEMSWESFASSTTDQRKYLRRLLALDFDYVLTTNYSYELELALLDKGTIRPTGIARLQNFTEVNHAQTQFLMNTYNSCRLNGVDKQIWHIHGEARKPDSIIIGHYYYGKVLRRVVERLDKNRNDYLDNIRNRREQSVGSWADAFAWGDVYIAGLGMDFSESDLWWLIEYKNFHGDGSVTYYEPGHDAKDVCALSNQIPCSQISDYHLEAECKKMLMRNSGVSVQNLGVTIHSTADYAKFYESVYQDLAGKV